MLEVAAAFRFLELAEDAAASFPRFIDRALRTVTKQFLELPDGEFDGMEAGRVRRQVMQFGAGSFNRFHESHFSQDGSPVTELAQRALAVE